jgi:hypothetical protein
MGLQTRLYGEDGDLGGGTKLRFDETSENAAGGRGGGGTLQHSSPSALGRLRANYPSVTGALVGSALATAVHAARVIAAATEEGGGLAAVSLALSPVRALASFVVGCVVSGNGGPDGVDHFLGDIHLGDYAHAFRVVGYVSEVGAVQAESS